DLQKWKELTHILVYIHYIGIMVFPMNVKGSTGSLVSLVNWSCSWIVTYSFNFMMEWSSAGTFFIYMGICGSAVLSVAKLVPETKGRVLEEIQASITHLHQ
ncbi:sugar transporter ERD6-like 5 isoform X2, partial [Fagus crenata]